MSRTSPLRTIKPKSTQDPRDRNPNRSGKKSKEWFTVLLIPVITMHTATVWRRSATRLQLLRDACPHPFFPVRCLTEILLWKDIEATIIFHGWKWRHQHQSMELNYKLLSFACFHFHFLVQIKSSVSVITPFHPPPTQMWFDHFPWFFEILWNTRTHVWTTYFYLLVYKIGNFQCKTFTLFIRRTGWTQYFHVLMLVFAIQSMSSQSDLQTVNWK